MHHYQRLSAALIAMLCMSVIACGSTRIAGQAANNEGTPTSGSTPPSNATPTSTPSGNPQGAGVTVRANRSTYGVGDSIDITIHNGLAFTITPNGGHTSCTPIILERSANASWQSLGDCLTDPPTQILEISPGASVVIQVKPSTSRGTSGPWQTGTYRATVEYVNSANLSGGPTTMVSSPSFTIA